MERKDEKSAYTDSELLEVRKRVHRYICDNALETVCQVEVQKRDRWFVFQGQVNSAGTRGRLFRLVPSIEGAKWIIDRLHVGRPVDQMAARGRLRS